MGFDITESFIRYIQDTDKQSLVAIMGEQLGIAGKQLKVTHDGEFRNNHKNAIPYLLVQTDAQISLYRLTNTKTNLKGFVIYGLHSIYYAEGTIEPMNIDFQQNYLAELTFQEKSFFKKIIRNFQTNPQTIGLDHQIITFKGRWQDSGYRGECCISNEKLGTFIMKKYIQQHVKNHRSQTSGMKR